MQDLDIQIQYRVCTEYALPTYLNTGVSHPSQMGVVMDAIIAISVDYDPHCQFTHPKKKKTPPPHQKSHCIRIYSRLKYGYVCKAVCLPQWLAGHPHLHIRSKIDSTSMRLFTIFF